MPSKELPDCVPYKNMLRDEQMNENEFTQCEGCLNTEAEEDMKTCVDCGRERCKKCSAVCPVCLKWVCNLCYDADYVCIGCRTNREKAEKK